MSRPLSVGVAGLGTVGGGVLKLLRANADIIAARAGRAIAVTAVSARDRNRDRGLELGGLRWYEDPVALANDADKLIDRVSLLLTAGSMSASTRAQIRTAVNSVTIRVAATDAETDRRNRPRCPSKMSAA